MHIPCIYHEDYVTPLPDGHRFPMPKFKLLYEKLVQEGFLNPMQVYRPQSATVGLLQKAHDQAYIEDFCRGRIDAGMIRRIGLPWSPQLVIRACTAVGGTYLTARLALEFGIACNLAGGTHHAFPAHGSGFCIFNDLAVAARAILDEGRANKILIIDLDVHQGDGTAYIFRDEPRVVTFSMHCASNFPFQKQRSDFDIGLGAATEDAAYLRILGRSLPDLLSEVRPDLVIYDAGIDPHINDKLGHLALTSTGIYRRDLMVLRLCRDRGIPVACVVGGGYTRDRDELIFLHSLIFRAAHAVWPHIPTRPINEAASLSPDFG